MVAGRFGAQGWYDEPYVSRRLTLALGMQDWKQGDHLGDSQEVIMAGIRMWGSGGEGWLDSPCVCT